MQGIGAEHILPGDDSHLAFRSHLVELPKLRKILQITMKMSG